MTDARLPGRWLTDPRMDGLSDRAWRTFTGSLMWSNEAGTDGKIPPRAMRFLHPEGVDSATTAELIKAGLWAPDEGTVFVPNWELMGQELAEVVNARRAGNRTRKRNERERRKTKVTEVVTADVTRDVTGSQEDRTGKDRTGKDRQGIAEAKVTSWPVVVPGSGRVAS
ncbi:hypothetical protein [Herbiconiux solani]|uniref:hypothetical protein n=1 Tax=Herbiconiux solani TaxID=661329 RepID=UPI0012EE5DDE|nr:hypothetical protein [Herbiconiux solani]